MTTRIWMLTMLACTCRSRDYGEPLYFIDWEEFRLPDFSVRFLGCVGDEGCDLLLQSATDHENIHWASHPGCIEPLPFEIDGGSYVLEANCSVVEPAVETSFLVVWRREEFERRRALAR